MPISNGPGMSRDEIDAARAAKDAAMDQADLDDAEDAFRAVAGGDSGN